MMQPIEPSHRPGAGRVCVLPERCRAGIHSFGQRLALRLDYKRALPSDMLAGPQDLKAADFEDL